MMQIAWASDIHLDIARFGGFETLMNEIRDLDPDALLLTGDLATGDSLIKWLKMMDDWLQIPIYFVLGNHDYYNSSIETVRSKVDTFAAASPQLDWLPTAGVVQLSPEVALVGHGGWADGRAGVGIAHSLVRMRDHIAIEELYESDDLIQMVAELADESTRHIAAMLDTLDDSVSHVIVATHVPPFKEACLYLGEPTDNDFLPHFSSPGLGEMLVEHAEQNPLRKITVLAGHTHDPSRTKPHDRVEVHVAGATYERPEVTGVIGIEQGGATVGISGLNRSQRS